jgi:hypothetical protein
MGMVRFCFGLILCAVFIGDACAQTVFRCQDKDGKTVFQQARCEDKGLKGSELTLRAGNMVAALPPAASTPSPPPGKQEPPPQPVVQSAPPTPRNPRADACLNWYRPLLRDPMGAYYTEVKLEERSVTMRLHATNGFGGYVSKQAACDFDVGGKLDDGWTKIQAERLGW